MKKDTKQILFSLLKGAAVLGITMALLVLYELSVRYVWEAVFWVYFVTLAAASLYVVIRNYGFSRSFVKYDELPASWTEGQKNAFFAEAKDAWRKTKPIVFYLILPIALCFGFDVLCLFLWGPLVDLFPFLG